MLKDARAELLGRHLPPGASLEGELALLASLPTHKQLAVEQRLRIIDRYLAGKSQRPPDADKAAAEIGVARLRFYRLVAKVREVGPVRALSPGFRNAQRSAPSKNGLPEPVENVIRGALQKQPDVKIAIVEQLVGAECARIHASVPSSSAIKRRVHALRRSGLGPLNARFGERLVMDQVALELPVRNILTASLAVVNMLMDVNTRLVVGCSLTAGDGIALGIRFALNDAHRRLRSLERNGMSVADRISEFTWIVPPGLEYARDLLGTEQLNYDRRPIIKVVGSGPRRHGDRILRLLGDRLGPHSFRRLPDLGQNPPKVRSEAIEADDAARLVEHSVDAWNASILRRLQGSEAEDEPVAQREARLNTILRDVDLLFAPIFKAVEDREYKARIGERAIGDFLG